MKRIVVLLSRMARAEEVIGAAVEKAGELGAGVTLLYVRKERLFELPIFSENEPSLDAIREHLQVLVREAGGVEWALLAYEEDPVDRVLVEAEREKAGLIMTDLDGEARDDLIEKVTIPLLLLHQEIRHECEKALMVFDPAYSGTSCLDTVRNILGARRWSAYLDYQIVVTTGTDLSLDPMIDTLNIDVEMEEELMETRKKAFEELCEAEGLTGTFEVGEQGPVEDVLVRAAREEAECLALIVANHETLLAGTLPELAAKVRRDLLICFQNA